MCDGPTSALGLVDKIADCGRLSGYYLLPAVRADLLRRLGQFDEAATEYRNAIALVGSEPERRFLLRRLSEAVKSSGIGL